MRRPLVFRLLGPSEPPPKGQAQPSELYQLLVDMPPGSSAEVDRDDHTMHKYLTRYKKRYGLQGRFVVRRIRMPGWCRVWKLPEAGEAPASFDPLITEPIDQPQGDLA